MVELEKIEMTEQDLAEKKLHLASCKIQKDETDLMLLEMEEHLDAKLATRLLDDDITKIKNDLDNKIIHDSFGKEVTATDADIDRMKITLDKFEKQKELDLPARQMRFKINQLREAKKRPDAPELQIKKLEREVKEKAFYSTARAKPANMCT